MRVEFVIFSIIAVVVILYVAVIVYYSSKYFKHTKQLSTGAGVNNDDNMVNQQEQKTQYCSKTPFQQLQNWFDAEIKRPDNVFERNNLFRNNQSYNPEKWSRQVYNSLSEQKRVEIKKAVCILIGSFNAKNVFDIVTTNCVFTMPIVTFYVSPEDHAKAYAVAQMFNNQLVKELSPNDIFLSVVSQKARERCFHKNTSLSVYKRGRKTIDDKYISLFKKKLTEEGRIYIPVSLQNFQQERGHRIGIYLFLKNQKLEIVLSNPHIAYRDQRYPKRICRFAMYTRFLLFDVFEIQHLNVEMEFKIFDLTEEHNCQMNDKLCCAWNAFYAYLYFSHDADEEKLHDDLKSNEFEKYFFYFILRLYDIYARGLPTDVYIEILEYFNKNKSKKIDDIFTEYKQYILTSQWCVLHLSSSRSTWEVLLNAIQYENWDVVRFAIRNKYFRKSKPLLCAIRKGHSKMLEFILNVAKDNNIKLPTERNKLLELFLQECTECCSEDQLKKFKIILELPETNVLQVDIIKLLSLHDKSCNETCVNKMLQMMLEKMKKRLVDKNNPLCIALNEKRFLLTCTLIEKQDNPKLKCNNDKSLREILPHPHFIRSYLEKYSSIPGGVKMQVEKYSNNYFRLFGKEDFEFAFLDLNKDNFTINVRSEDEFVKRTFIKTIFEWSKELFGKVNELPNSQVTDFMLTEFTRTVTFSDDVQFSVRLYKGQVQFSCYSNENLQNNLNEYILIYFVLLSKYVNKIKKFNLVGFFSQGLLRFGPTSITTDLLQKQQEMVNALIQKQTSVEKFKEEEKNYNLFVEKNHIPFELVNMWDNIRSWDNANLPPNSRFDSIWKTLQMRQRSEIFYDISSLEQPRIDDLKTLFRAKMDFLDIFNRNVQVKFQEKWKTLLKHNLATVFELFDTFSKNLFRISSETQIFVKRSVQFGENYSINLNLETVLPRGDGNDQKCDLDASFLNFSIHLRENEDDYENLSFDQTLAIFTGNQRFILTFTLFYLIGHYCLKLPKKNLCFKVVFKNGEEKSDCIDNEENSFVLVNVFQTCFKFIAAQHLNLNWSKNIKMITKSFFERVLYGISMWAPKRITRQGERVLYEEEPDYSDNSTFSESTSTESTDRAVSKRIQ